MNYTNQDLINYLVDVMGYTEFLHITDINEANLSTSDLEEMIDDWDDFKDFTN